MATCDPTCPSCPLNVNNLFTRNEWMNDTSGETIEEEKRRKKKKWLGVLPPAWLMMLLHLQVGLIVYVIRKTYLTLRSYGLWRTQFPSKSRTCREEVYGRWNGLPASREATWLTIIWRLPTVHDHIERPPILYLLSFIFYLFICI